MDADSRVTLQPSSKTSYVVLGDNAGPSKLAAIKKHGLKTLSEDAFLALIGSRVGPSGTGGSAQLDQKTRKKMEKEEEAIREAARALERREKEAAREGKGKGKAGGYVRRCGRVSRVVLEGWLISRAQGRCDARRGGAALDDALCASDAQRGLWEQGPGGEASAMAARLVRFVPVCLLGWAHATRRSSSLKSGFNKPGKNGMNVFRAVLVSGPPGIGKTTSAHLCAKLEGFTPIELNASDARSKKLVEVRIRSETRPSRHFLTSSVSIEWYEY